MANLKANSTIGGYNVLTYGDIYIGKDSIDQEMLANANDLRETWEKAVSAYSLAGTKLNATDNAVSASKLLTARTISVTGGATGSFTFDGSTNVSVSLSVNNTTHNHDSTYLKLTGGTLTGTLTTTDIKLINQSTGLVNKFGNNMIRGSGEDVGITVIGNMRGCSYIDSSVNPRIRIGNTNAEYPIYHTGNKPSKTDVGLNLVDNTADSNKNVLSATKLTTARNITIGNTAKSFNGSANVVWSMAEIGALPLTGGTVSGAITFSNANNQLIGKRTADNDLDNRLLNTEMAWSYTGTSDAAVTTNKFNTINNANGILSFNTHSGGFGHQIGLSSDGKLYHRHKSGPNWNSWAGIYSSNNKPNKTDIGLNLVDNTSDSSKNVLSATKLTTIRTINGTNFDGTANITTANWGTARTITVGSTGKSINGSANIAWTLAEIGAAPTSHTHDYVPNSSVYGGDGSSAGVWNKIPKVGGDGVLEVGKYIDFHAESTGNTDFDVRLTATNGSLHCSGSFTATKTHNPAYNDYAEYFPKEEGYYTEAGDIIALRCGDGDEIYELAKDDGYCNSGLVVGVHSDEYGHLMGGEYKPDDFDGTQEEWNEKKYIPVGLVGRVYVKFKGTATKGTMVVPSEIAGVGRAFNPLYDKDTRNVVGYIVENKDMDGIYKVRIKLGK